MTIKLIQSLRYALTTKNTIIFIIFIKFLVIFILLFKQFYIEKPFAIKSYQFWLNFT